MDQVIKHFYGDLVSKLPMNDATFRASLYSADLLPGDLKQAVQAKSTSADKAEYFIDHGINNDAAKFAKLLDVMAKSGDISLVSLAAEIRSYSGTTAVSNDHQSTGAAADTISAKFDCNAARAQITSLYTDITALPINKILGELFCSKVILDNEKAVIETMPLESKRMEHLLDKIILPSLVLKVTVKYKRFLEVMERSEDVVLNSMAQRLGGSKRVPE